VNQLVLDAKTLAFVRIAATIAVGGSVGSFGAETDAAIAAGATNDEIVDVLDSVQPIVGGPRAVEAAGQLALALGYDLDEMP
jgi:alkylhydroperoxidase/carboxymuconolactone decarboxylase family protein YurZ